MKSITSYKSKKYFAIAGLIFLFATMFFVAVPRAHALEPIYQVLEPKCPASFSTTVHPSIECFTGMGKVTAQIWYNIMDIVDSLVLAALIWIAFMNILRIQLDSYAVKKILPTFIFAIILANFSFLIARMMIDIANIAISAFLTGNAQSGVTGAFNIAIKEKPRGPGDVARDPAITNYAGYIMVYILKQIFVAVGAVMVAILAFIFLIRNYFIYFLICIAPAAYMAMILPITKKYFQQWWSQFLKWIFMPVVAVFWLWLAGLFLAAIDPDAIWVLPMGFAGVCLYMAITSPFKLGGAVVGAWQNYGKKAWGATGGQAVKGAGWMAGGGYASWRAYANQQKAVVAKSRSVSDNDIWAQKAKKFEANANRWTKANPRAWREGIKSRITTGATNAQKAPSKTPWYNTLAGRTAAIDANYNASFESDRNRTGADAGIEARKQLGKIWSQLNPDYLNRMKVESRKTERSRERAVLGFSDTEAGLDAYQKHLVMADFDDKGAAKLDVTHQGIGAKPLGDLKSIADAYRKNLRRRENKEELLRAFITEPGALSADLGASARQNRGANARQNRGGAAGTAPAAASSSGFPGSPPIATGPGGTQTEEDIRALTAYHLATGVRKAADETATAGQNGQGGQGRGGGGADNSRVEELLEQILAQSKEGGGKIDQAMAQASRPTAGVFAGAGLPQHVIVDEIQRLNPQAAEQFKKIETGANNQFIKLQQAEGRTLQTVAESLKNGQSPEGIQQLVGQGRELLAKGDVEGAKRIALQINPSAEQSLNLTTKGSLNG